jgi:hypothetical protein
LERGGGRLILLGRNAQVQVTERAKTRLGVEPGDGPAFPQQRFHADGAKQLDGRGDLALVERCLERLKPVGLPKLVSRSCSLQRRGSNSPPSQAAGTGSEQQRRHFSKGSRFAIEGGWNASPSAGQHRGHPRAQALTALDRAVPD